MMKNDPPEVPEHLEPATKVWWAEVTAGWCLEDHHTKLLTLAGEAYDRCTAAREAIEANGLTFTDRFGTPKARPEVAIERDSRLAFARLLRELALDVCEPAESPRPSPIRGNAALKKG